MKTIYLVVRDDYSVTPLIAFETRDDAEKVTELLDNRLSNSIEMQEIIMLESDPRISAFLNEEGE